MFRRYWPFFLLAPAVLCFLAVLLALTTSPRRVGKLLLGYVTNEYEHIVYSLRARSVACPRAEEDRAIVLVVLGQSNAGNSIVNWPVEAPIAGVSVFYDGSCYSAVSPLVGNGGIHGSLWPTVGHGILRQGRWSHVVLATMAVASSSVSQWAPGGRLHRTLLTRLRSLQRAGFQQVALLWHQGESDHGGDPDAYTDSLRALIASARAVFADARFYVSTATRCGREPDPRIAAAQRAAVNPLDNILPGPDTDELGHDYRADGCHFNISGGHAAAALWLNALLKH